MRPALTWAGLAAAMLAPVLMAATSPLLAWREPVYIAAGFAGVIGLSLLLAQPLLMLGLAPGLSARARRRWHRAAGLWVLAAAILHVAGLWITSPPDVIDALLLRSPTPFSDWGVIALGAVIATAALAAFRRRLRLSPRAWRIAHGALAALLVGGTVAHAWLIQGTMEIWSKAMISALVLGATGYLLAVRRFRAR